MTAKVVIWVPVTEKFPVEVHELRIGAYPAGAAAALVKPGSSIEKIVYPGQEILIRALEPVDSQQG